MDSSFFYSLKIKIYSKSYGLSGRLGQFEGINVFSRGSYWSLKESWCPKRAEEEFGLHRDSCTPFV
jgi:hypothetical protein